MLAGDSGCPHRVSTPHYSSGLLIEKNEAYTKVYSRAGLSLMWNREDALMVGTSILGPWGGWLLHQPRPGGPQEGRGVQKAAGDSGSTELDRPGPWRAFCLGAVGGPQLSPGHTLLLSGNCPLTCHSCLRCQPGLGLPGPCGLLTCPFPPQLELDSRFQNHTCGLCGDFNGLQTYSEFLSEGECQAGGSVGQGQGQSC